MAKKHIKAGVFIALLVILAGSSNAADLVAPKNKNTWETDDTIWQIAYLMSHVADWGQTRDIALNCSGGRYIELNPILGGCPNIARVNTYFMATALLHAGVSVALPRKYRRFFQTSTLVMELGYVTNNYNIGLKFNF